MALREVSTAIDAIDEKDNTENKKELSKYFSRNSNFKTIR
jgi:hypothetical protein